MFYDIFGDVSHLYALMITKTNQALLNVTTQVMKTFKTVVSFFMP